jgi:hypothetical protein
MLSARGPRRSGVAYEVLVAFLYVCFGVIASIAQSSVLLAIFPDRPEDFSEKMSERSVERHFSPSSGNLPLFSPDFHNTVYSVVRWVRWLL